VKTLTYVLGHGVDNLSVIHISAYSVYLVDVVGDREKNSAKLRNFCNHR
jgi:hypothetical protein